MSISQVLGGGHGISTLHSTNRHRVINAVVSEKSGTPGTIANCELDTHADTCVAGANFLIEELTGEYCDVASFLNEYKPMREVPIVNASTAFTNNAGALHCTMHPLVTVYSILYY